MSDPSTFTQLQQWLDWQETLHPSEIDLGLHRVALVLQRLYPDIYHPSRQSVKYPFTIITIAGTNGKGSTIALLSSILTQAGYCVGAYSSPHLQSYNERICINQVPVKDILICDAFTRINEVRDDISLTYFEFATLAAVEVFYQQQCDIVILEVGLGGRLDAVNAIDPDVAFVSTVDFDHQDWLGNDLNTIALEKAGIYRRDKPAIYGDEPLIDSIREKVHQQSLDFYQYGKDYNYRLREQQWDWLPAQGSPFNAHYNLPLPALAGNIQLKNAANVLFILKLLKLQWPVTQADIKQGLLSVQISGRFQILQSRPLIIADVAHNVQAARVLKTTIDDLTVPGKFHIIAGMLKDKDIINVLSCLLPVAASWRIIELNSPRAMPADELKQILQKITGPNTEIKCFADFKQAYSDFEEANKKSAKEYNIAENQTDNLLIMGSFFTVSDALRNLQS